MPALASDDLTNWTRPRATLASLKARGFTEADSEVIEARRDLKAARLAEHITRVVDDAPPLSAEQRERLAMLLRPVPAAGGGGHDG